VPDTLIFLVPLSGQGRWHLAAGDCRALLPLLPERSVHCMVTSPPYWSLRDDGHAGQLGREPTPDHYVAALVDVFREVRRVLRDDGTAWRYAPLHHFLNNAPDRQPPTGSPRPNPLPVPRTTARGSCPCHACRGPRESLRAALEAAVIPAGGQ
jgi:hypothetical protein